MRLTIRDDRQMKALTGVSQAQFDFPSPRFGYPRKAGHSVT
jgi:hypothetical protein